MRTYRTTIVAEDKGRVWLPVPFDPDVEWGPKPRHHVCGFIDDVRFRGPVEAYADGWGVNIGHSWRLHGHVPIGPPVDVSIDAEGPQRADLPADLAAALDADPEAGAFFDGLAQFYRKAYLKWVDVRKPEVRVERTAELIELLRGGQKARPRR